MSGLLTALNDTGKHYISFDIEDEFGYRCNWYCPLCNEHMYYQKRSTNGTVAHFNHKTARAHPGLSEGKLHMTAKKRMFQKLQEDNNIADIKLEHPIGDQSPINPNRIADIYVKLEEGTEIAVEIQTSIQSAEQFEQRTDDYNDHDLHVLWLLDGHTYFPSKESRDGAVSGVAFKKGVKWLQRHYYGRSYTFSEKSLEDQSITAVTPVRVDRISRLKESYDHHGNYHHHNYTYKTIGEFSSSTIPNYGLLATTSNGRKIARFYDSAWWTEG